MALRVYQISKMMKPYPDKPVRMWVYQSIKGFPYTVLNSNHFLYEVFTPLFDPYVSGETCFFTVHFFPLLFGVAPPLCRYSTKCITYTEYISHRVAGKCMLPISVSLSSIIKPQRGRQKLTLGAVYSMMLVWSTFLVYFMRGK